MIKNYERFLISFPLILLPFLVGGVHPWFWGLVAGIFFAATPIVVWADGHAVSLYGISKKSTSSVVFTAGLSFSSSVALAAFVAEPVESAADALVSNSHGGDASSRLDGKNRCLCPDNHRLCRHLVGVPRGVCMVASQSHSGRQESELVFHGSFFLCWSRSLLWAASSAHSHAGSALGIPRPGNRPRDFCQSESLRCFLGDDLAHTPGIPVVNQQKYGSGACFIVF